MMSKDSNDAVCYQNTLLPARFWLIGKVSIRKQIKFKCIEKFNYTCGNDKKYCAIDKGSCKRMNSAEDNIKQCKNSA